MRLVPATTRTERGVGLSVPSLRIEVKEAQYKTLDFDLETVAAGFADPNWVPQKITCAAWSWVGSDDVDVTIATTEGLYGRPERRRRMLEPLLDAINDAEMLTGHNLLRFDLPVLAAECMRLGLPVVGPILVQDTMRLRRAKGFKKGQDNISELFDLAERKLALTWQAWQDAYAEKGWPTVKERAVSDVRMHKVMREEMIARDWLKDPVVWRP